MTIRHLKVFIAVCEAGSITKAAEALHIAQPSVSQTVAELEKYYRVILFDRINQRLVLTEQGRILLAKAKEVIAGFDEFESLASLSDKNPSVRIGASLTAGRTFVPFLLDEVRTRYPDADPFLVINKTAAIEEAVLEGDLDFGIVEGNISSAMIRSVAFNRDRLAVVCGMSDPMPEEISVRDLPNYRLFVREEGSSTRDLLDMVLMLYGVRVKPAMVSVSNSAIIAAVVHGLGVSVLPYELVLPFIRTRRLREVRSDVSFERETCLIMHKNKKFTSVQKNVYQLCLDMNKKGSK